MGETAVAQEDNATIVRLLTSFNVTVLQSEAEDMTYLSRLAPIQSMVAGGGEFSRLDEERAHYVAETLGRDVLILCSSELNQKRIIDKLGELHFSIVFPKRDFWEMAIKNHVVSQQMRNGDFGIPSGRNRAYSVTGNVLDKRGRRPMITGG